MQCEYPTSQWRENHSILVVQIHSVIGWYMLWESFLSWKDVPVSRVGHWTIKLCDCLFTVYSEKNTWKISLKPVLSLFLLLGYCSWQLLCNILFPLYCFMGFPLALPQVLTMSKSYHSATENIKYFFFWVNGTSSKWIEGKILN